MNSVILIGRLTKDPELRFVAGSGKAVATFTLAVDRPFAKEKTADFFKIVVWGKTGENTANYLKKGSQAGVKGILTNRSYDDNDGQKKYITEVVADTVEFLSRSENGNSGNTQSQSKDNAPWKPSNDFAGFMELTGDDDLPF